MSVVPWSMLACTVSKSCCVARPPCKQFSEIKRAFPKLLVGAIYNTTILDAAINAGADYIVTPTVPNSLLLAMLSSGIPFIPGEQNMRDIAEVMEHG